MRQWITHVAAVALVLALVGCSGSTGGGTGAEPRLLELTTNNMAFAMKEISVAKGQPVQLVLANQDALLHDFSIDRIPVSVTKPKGNDHQHGGGEEPDLHVSADAGKSQKVVFTPTKEGKYTYYCTVPGHREAGMVGTMIVL